MEMYAKVGLFKWQELQEIVMFKKTSSVEKKSELRDRTLNQIVDLLADRKKIDDSEIVIEMYKLNRDELQFYFSYQSIDGTFISELDLPHQLYATIKEAFNILWRKMNHGLDNALWNKARFIVVDDEDFEFEHKYCADVEWISGMAPEEYPTIDGFIGAQTVIYTWRGLPDGYKRPWSSKN